MAACISTLAVADDRADYDRRSAERYIAMFRLADLNKDNVVTVGEAQGIIELQAHFNDIDTDRDGDITWEELTRYIEATFR
jgi:Ca2+-binding EF-hand superfamily protein